MPPTINLRDVTADNWRDCAALAVAENQREFVTPVTYYLCLCHYGGIWHPLAAYAGEEIVGFVMWAVDPADSSGWIGGLTVDEKQQRQGYGRAIVETLARRLRDTHGCTSCALSYTAANSVARRLYAALGFVETGEVEDDEIVARLPSERI